MATNTIRKSEWAAYLASFSAQHAGWLVLLDGLNGGRGELPLESIGLLHNGAVEVRLATPGIGKTPALERTIGDPDEILVDEQPDGAIEELTVRGRGGDELRVRFASIIAPQLVDGVLPELVVPSHEEVHIHPARLGEPDGLEGDLSLPPRPSGIILFAHGSGSSRHSPRNRFVASTLHEAGFATLLFDLLTLREESADARSGHLRFDIELLAARLIAAIDWTATRRELEHLPLGLFGASTGAAAALLAASRRSDVRAVVSRGGRPDLAGQALTRVRCPTLLVVGERDVDVLGLNRRAYALLAGPKEIATVPGATHLFPEPGTLGRAARLATRWFGEHLVAHSSHAGHAPG